MSWDGWTGDRCALAYKGSPPNHCCVDQALRILPNGQWIIVFMTGGVMEPEPENHIELVRSDDDGWSWSDPEIVLRYDDHACLLSEVYLHDGRIVVHTSEHDGSFGRWLNYTIESADDGRTWSDPLPFEPVPRRGFIRNRYVASDGRWILPVQSYDTVEDWETAPHADGTFKHPFNCVLLSEDEGRTWERSGRVEPAHAWAENNVVELSDGRIVMLTRYDGSGRIYRADSADGGRTWSESTPTEIPNPGTKFRLHRLSDGRIVLVHNASERTSHPNSRRAAQCHRNPLSLWVSEDDMETWGYKRDLTFWPGMLAYPDGVVSDDEQFVHFAFDHNRHDVIYWGARLPAPGETAP